MELIPTFKGQVVLIIEIGALGCPETSITIYHCMLLKIQEESGSRLHSDISLKSRCIAVTSVALVQHEVRSREPNVVCNT